MLALLQGVARPSTVTVDSTRIRCEYLSRDPNVTVLHGFCSPDEAKAIVKTAEQTLDFARSEVGLDGDDNHKPYAYLILRCPLLCFVSRVRIFFTLVW